MTLITYPLENANSFVTLVEADALAESLQGYDEWLSLTDIEKQRLLINAYREIISLTGIELPDDNTQCLKDSQIGLAVHDNNNSISTSLGLLDDKIKSATVGSVSVEYVSGTPTTQVSYWSVSSYVKKCLSSYGALIPSTGFSQGKLRRS